MDLVQFARHRRGGGNDRLLAWEFSAGLKDWARVSAAGADRLLAGRRAG